MKTNAEELVSQARMSLHHHIVSGMYRNPGGFFPHTLTASLKVRFELMSYLESEQTRISHAAIQQDNWLSHQALGALLQEERVGRSERAWLGHMLNATLHLLLEQSSRYI
jgi:hypothetical protein